MDGSSRSRQRTVKGGSPRGGTTSRAPELSIAVAVTADEHGIHVTFEDGRVLIYPLTERLRLATPEQRAAGEVDAFGTALHWEEIDEDLGVNTVLGVSEDELYDFAGFTKGMPEK